MRSPAHRASIFRRVWAIPLILAVLTIFGLLSALLGNGIWHALAWASLASPIVVAVRFAMKRRRC